MIVITTSLLAVGMLPTAPAHVPDFATGAQGTLTISGCKETTVAAVAAVTQDEYEGSFAITVQPTSEDRLVAFSRSPEGLGPRGEMECAGGLYSVDSVTVNDYQCGSGATDPVLARKISGAAPVVDITVSGGGATMRFVSSDVASVSGYCDALTRTVEGPFLYPYGYDDSSSSVSGMYEKSTNEGGQAVLAAPLDVTALNYVEIDAYDASYNWLGWKSWDEVAFQTGTAVLDLGGLPVGTHYYLWSFYEFDEFGLSERWGPGFELGTGALSGDSFEASPGGGTCLYKDTAFADNGTWVNNAWGADVSSSATRDGDMSARVTADGGQDWKSGEAGAWILGKPVRTSTSTSMTAWFDLNGYAEAGWWKRTADSRTQNSAGAGSTATGVVWSRSSSGEFSVVATLTFGGASSPYPKPGYNTDELRSGGVRFVMDSDKTYFPLVWLQSSASRPDGTAGSATDIAAELNSIDWCTV